MTARSLPADGVVGGKQLAQSVESSGFQSSGFQVQGCSGGNLRPARAVFRRLLASLTHDHFSDPDWLYFDILHLDGFDDATLASLCARMDKLERERLKEVQ